MDVPAFDWGATYLPGGEGSGAPSGDPEEINLDDDGNPLPNTFPRLRDGIERFFITDINNPGAGAAAQSSIAVMFDAWGLAHRTYPHEGEGAQLNFNHIPGGSNVLFMDGHVEFIRFNERYPIQWLDEDEHPRSPGAYAHLLINRVGGYG